MSNLEDAYLNIVRDEDYLLEELKKNGVRKFFDKS
jgi:hypothetical protein